MDANEAMDREVIVERAEAVRSWLGELGLSSRAMSALDRELMGIISNDPGGYINGRRPLAGLTVDDVIAELQQPNAGAVGKVRSVGDSIIAELRAAINLERGALPAASNGAEEPEAAEAKPARRRQRRAAQTSEAAPEPVAAEAAPAAAEVAPAPAEPEAKPARRGRPRRAAASATPTSEAAAEPAPTPEAAPAEAAPAQSEPEAKPARRGRPRRVRPVQTSEPAAAPAAAPEAAPAPAADSADPALERLMRLWPSLHAQGRRAVVLYASTLLFEQIGSEG